MIILIVKSGFKDILFFSKNGEKERVVIFKGKEESNEYTTTPSASLHRRGNRLEISTPPLRRGSWRGSDYFLMLKIQQNEPC